MPNYQTLLFKVDETGIATVTINRPQKLNALNKELFYELDQVVQELKQDNAIKGVIVTGAGDKAFVAGADIKELSGLEAEEAERVSLNGQQVFQAIEGLPKPVVAAVNGYALGGGAELAMACHLRIAGENAQIGLPEVTLGLIPGYGGTQRLSRLIGKPQALEIILTGKLVNAERARQMGLVNMVASAPYEEAQKLLQQILQNGPLAIQKAIEAVQHTDPKTGFAKEAKLFGALSATDDAREGTMAFLEKRNPEFKGR